MPVPVPAPVPVLVPDVPDVVPVSEGVPVEVPGPELLGPVPVGEVGGDALPRTVSDVREFLDTPDARGA